MLSIAVLRVLVRPQKPSSYPHRSLKNQFNALDRGGESGIQVVAWQKFIERWRAEASTPTARQLLRDANDEMLSAQATATKYGPQCPVLKYPMAARRAEAQGTTRIKVRYDAGGKLEGAEVVTSAGGSREHKMLDRQTSEWVSACLRTTKEQAGKSLVFDYVWKLD